METKIICFANNKGGSGKSTACSNIGYSLWALGKKVLLIDADMQMNLSLAFFSEEIAMEYATSGKNIYTCIHKQDKIDGYIVPTEYEELDIVCSSSLLSGIEYELFTKWQRETIFKRSIASLVESEKYDYICIDAPPTLGGWVMNLLCGATDLIIPVEASPWGLFGLANMFDFCQEVRNISPNLNLMGIMMTKVNLRKNYYKQTRESLEEMEGVRIFTTPIRIDSEIEWAQEHSMPVMAYKKTARSAGEYMALTKEILGIGEDVE